MTMADLYTTNNTTPTLPAGLKVGLMVASAWTDRLGVASVQLPDQMGVKEACMGASQLSEVPQLQIMSKQRTSDFMRNDILGLIECF